MAADGNSVWMGWRYHGDLLPTRVNCYTRKIIEECYFTWTIENFHFLIMGEGQDYCIKSPNFPPASNKVYKWNLQFFPLGTKENQSILIKLSLISTPKTNAKTNCLITFRDSNDCELVNTFLTGVYPSGVAGHVLDCTINSNPVLKKFFVNNEDVIKIEVKITSTLENSEELLEIKESSCQKEISMRELLEDLSRLFSNKNLSDAVINVKGTKFHVHQAILAARSPLLSVMIQNNKKENCETVIEIMDIEPDNMKKILHFLYTSHIEYDSVTEALQILKAADKYEIKNLKKLSEDYLIFKLNVDNVLSILNVANDHNAPELKSKAIEYICKSKDSFTNMEKYVNANIKNSELLIEVLVSMANISKTSNQP